eukprot:Plantae.Rhodophyta-Hildenbrandia_rubra.ctg3088.p2 GENE.Plantae.Rhodophyta-Hildenbrandia_rubra.ctg3088~~Plantae.Rhodophyta-Hildenbrandia_rubra.ctg3088.p2  ORF type:complete len:302 (+),score=48.61 Plantae.Rhodophyta-Hildenbrandia_rubra.ctg3088:328-1233(+)
MALAFGLSLGHLTRKSLINDRGNTPRCALLDGRRSRRKTKILTWNVAGLRGLLRKSVTTLDELVKKEQPDIICLQETKLQQVHETDFQDILDGYTSIFHSSSSRKGYSGNVVFFDRKRFSPLGVGKEIGHEVDNEGRTITIEFDQFIVMSCYTPNVGQELKRLQLRLSWDEAMRKYIYELGKKGKPLVLAGDLNVARCPIDLHDPVRNRNSPGFTVEERMSFEELLSSNGGMIDSFRELYPDEEERYTFWSYQQRARDRNAGWRIDYFLVSSELFPYVEDCRILDHVRGSDHCPVAVDLTW